MSKPIFCIGVCALIAAAAIFVGSSHLRQVEAATTGSAMSTTEMTTNDNRPLPVEQWDAY